MTGWENGWGLEFLVFMNNFGGRALDAVFEPFHWIGGQAGYVALLPSIFWCINDRTGRRLFALAMTNVLANEFLKAWWARPRPYQVAPDRIVPAHVESSFGIPSGHTQSGTVLGLFFARQAHRAWVKSTMYLLIVLMGLSRMVMGVHFLQDVLAGWLIGAAVFVLFLRIEETLLPKIRAGNAAGQFMLALIPIALAVSAEYLFSADFPKTKNLHAAGGALSGIFIGMIVETRRGYFRSTGPVWKRILRAPLGLALLVGIQVGLSTVYHGAFPGESAGFGGILTYGVRYLFTGFAGYWLIPELFILTGLAERRERA